MCVVPVISSASELLYIAPGVIELVAAPRADGDVIARLRVNTQIRVEERRDDDWVAITMEDRPDSHPVSGWVPAQSLASAPLEYAGAMLEAREATFDTAVAASELAVSIDPSRDEAWERLLALQLELNREEEVARIRRHLRGEEDIFFGVCDGRRAKFIGRLSPDGTFDSSYFNSDRRKTLGASLAVRAWFMTEPNQARPTLLHGTPFPTPFLTPTDNEVGGTGYEPGISEMGGGLDTLVLGPCDKNGALLSTEPLAASRGSHVPLAETLLLAEALGGVLGEVYGITVRQPDLDSDYREIRAEVPYRFRDCGGIAMWPRTAHSWTAVLDGDVRAASSVVSSGDAGPTRWYRLPSGGHLVQFMTRWGSGYGVTFVHIGATGASAQMTKTLEAGGC